MNSHDLKIAWIGEANRHMDWLRQRVDRAALEYGVRVSHRMFVQVEEKNQVGLGEADPSRSGHALQAMSQAGRPGYDRVGYDRVGYDRPGYDRIIVSWSSRVSYPWHALARLESTSFVAPWAVVTGSWIDGARRTSIGAVSHPQLPWYRWWDAWHAWFFPERARDGALTAAHFAPVVNPLDWTRPITDRHRQPTVPKNHRTQPCLAILAGCYETRAMWQSMAEHVGWATTTARDIDDLVREQTPRDSTHPWQCVLIDDSFLATTGGSLAAIAQPLIARCQLASPACPITVALGLQHLTHWRELRQIGIDDFFIKPSFALPLAEYLHWVAR